MTLTGLKGDGNLWVSDDVVNLEWVLNNTVEINSDEISDSFGSGLSKISESIGDAKIVMLGEQSHGDGESFLVKTKLIKFLHEKKGFNIVAFESGFYELNTIWEKSDQEFRINNSKNSIYSVWSKSIQAQPFFDYAKNENQKGNRFIITGFDSRHSSTYSKKKYVQELDSALNAFQLSIVREESYLKFKEILTALIIKEYNHEPNESEKNLFFDTTSKIVTQIQANKNLSNPFWLQEIKNLIGNAKSVWSNKSNAQQSVNYRDKQMAENLLWLIDNKFKDEKIIVWAANYHIGKNDSEIEKQKYYNYEKQDLMGEILYPLLGYRMFNIAFTSGSGQYTDMGNTIRDVEISTGSLEELLNSTHYKYGFIDFKTKRNTITQPFIMSGFGHYELNGNWTHIFDGIFYIRQMSPSELTVDK